MDLAIVIITNGKNDSLQQVVDEWIKETYTLGKDLFICGPKKDLLKNSLFKKESILDYSDPKYNSHLFPINRKKHYAISSLNQEKILLIHDRFIPCKNFKSLLSKNGMSKKFGSFKVVNLDGSSSIEELRLKKSLLKVSLKDCIRKKGRLVCPKEHNEASNHIAINGGQFYLSKELANYLKRPLRWMEMEDDILSWDLKSYQGEFISLPYLINLRSKPKYVSNSNRIREYVFYIYAVLTFFAKFFIKNGVSLNEKLSSKELLSRKEIFLVDPLHKPCHSDEFLNSVEKLSVRLRLESNGLRPLNIIKTKFGWKIY